MNYKQLIKSALAHLNLPISFQVYTGKADTYITFFAIDELDTEFAENKPIATMHFIQVDVWSKSGDYDALVQQIQTAMTAAGFNTDGARDLYEPDTKIFHKAMRFNILEEGDL